MKKMVLVTAGLLSLFIIVMKSNADMRITPDGVRSPSGSTYLRLSGSFSNGPDANVIGGKNSYSGPDFSAGVYGSSEGTMGYGVCGRAGNAENSAENAGGYFLSLGGLGIGVYGESSGLHGYGVLGRASDNSVTINFGGYFEAKGTWGRGVYGTATADHGVGVYSVGGLYDFYAGGSGTNYGPFTGAHEVIFSKDMPGEISPGMIVSVTGKTEARKDKNGEISLSSTLPTVTISTRARDKAVFRVIVSDAPLPEDHWYETQEGERFGVVNALGEGRVWVTDINGKIEAGDYITTSSVPGYGQMQDDDLLHSYTLGKAIETIGWGQVAETIQHDGKTYKRYLIAVVYTSG